MRVVRDRPLHLLDPGPSAGDLEQTLLNQVFRLCEVPGDQVGRPQQRLSCLGDEAVEVNPGLALMPTCVHYLLQPSCVFERLPPITAIPEKSSALTCRWRSPRGDRWRAVWACPGHLDRLTCDFRESGRRHLTLKPAP